MDRIELRQIKLEIFFLLNYGKKWQLFFDSIAGMTLSMATNPRCYLVRENEDVDEVEDGSENTDGDSQVAVDFVVRIQEPLQYPKVYFI